MTLEDALSDQTLLESRTFGNRGGSWMQGGETATEMDARFRSEFQDYIAESCHPGTSRPAADACSPASLIEHRGAPVR